MENIRIGTQSLHEPLNGAIAQQLRDRPFFRNLLPEIEKFVLVLL